VAGSLLGVPSLPASLMRQTVKGVPVGRLLLLGDIALRARRHVALLSAEERWRIAVLVAAGARRRGALSRRERVELALLVAKMEPRAFLGIAASRMSPVPIPRRVLMGKRARRSP
jgi:hypothetical protein